MQTQRFQYLSLIVTAIFIIWQCGSVASAAQSMTNIVASASDSSNSGSASGNVTAKHEKQSVDSADYILGKGDRLTIHVFGADDLTDRIVDVSAEGDVIAPLLGRVSVGGMTVRNAEISLVEMYEKYFKHPEVTITIVEYRSQPVTVVGSVNSPGVIQLRRPSRLMDVISQAGGLRTDAGDKAVITRKITPYSSSEKPNENQQSIQEIDLHKIIEGQDRDGGQDGLNVLIQGGDLVTIPKAKMVYVVGDIGRPGGYVLEGHSDTITVLQAIALAGGVNKNSRTSQTRILRAANGSSQRTESTIDLQKILSNKAPDVELHADDILFVPNSPRKDVAIRSLEMAADIGTGLAIWHF